MNKRNRFGNVNLRSFTMVFALLVIMIFFHIVTDEIFISTRNLSMLFRQMSITGVITLGMMMLIVSGNFDLAVGSIVGLTGGIACCLQVQAGWSTVASISVAVLVGLICGAWQGLWVAYLKVPSFIVTLGGMMIFRGAYLIITDGITIGPLAKDFTSIAQSFLGIGEGYILAGAASVFFIVSCIRKRTSRARYGFDQTSKLLFLLQIIGGTAAIFLLVLIMNGYEGIPIPVLIFILLALLFLFLSQNTTFGRNIYAIGGNMEAARFSGIRVERNVFIMYIITGALSACSGVLLASRMDGAIASAGTSFEMDAIAACVIGGTSLTGGYGTIFGVVIGALVMATLDNGMSLMNLSSNYQSVVKGLVLIIAVLFDISARKKS